jgi:hypothetical protein
MDTYFEEEILTCRKRSEEIQNEFARLSLFVPESRKQDMEELSVAAGGIAWLNTLLLVFQKYECKLALKADPDAPALAGEIEAWLADYSRLWRNRNKESELGRIRALLFAVCDYLRSLQ